MTEIEKIRMLSSLVAARSQAIEIDNAWDNYTDAEQEQAFERLSAIQAKILSCDLHDSSAKLLALSILLDSTDEPNFADDFKNKLFTTLRRCNPEL